MNSMNLIELGRITSDEGESFWYLCNKFKDLSCPNCEQQVYYFMSRQRLRCKICGKDFNPLKSTKFSEIRISASSWLILIKLFELSVSARKASVEMNMSYKTTLKVLISCEKPSLKNSRNAMIYWRAKSNWMNPILAENKKEKEVGCCRKDNSIRNSGKRWQSFHGNREKCNWRDSYERNCEKSKTRKHSIHG